MANIKIKFEVRLLRNLLFSIVAFSLSPIFAMVVALNTVQNQVVLGDADVSQGVFAVNIDKSSYLENEEISIAYSVLDIMGTMVCDADIVSVIVDSNGNEVTQISTQNEKINAQPTCETKRNLHDLTPDYLGELKINKQGTYTLVSTATTLEKTYKSEKTIIIDNTPDFVVTRKTATRVFPKDPYKVILEIAAFEDFKGEVIEKTPLEFQIFRSKMHTIKTQDNNHTISWKVTWEKGSVYELSYKYKAPEVSPDLYKLGNLEFYANKTLDLALIVGLLNKVNITEHPIFIEQTTWELAIDDLLNHYSGTCIATGPKTWAPTEYAQGSPNLSSTAALSSFNATNSAVADTGDQPDMYCNSFSYRDLGSFTSANIVFSFAAAGANNGDDYVDVNYQVATVEYDLVDILQNTAEKSNNTNGGYWTYAAPNITNWSDLATTQVHFDGIKILKSDKNNAYVDAVWIEVDYTPRTFTQNDFEWFVTADSVTLTNAWPQGGGENLTENEAFTQFPASNEAMKEGDRIRLQMNVTVGAANLPTTIESFKLEYAAEDDCTAVSSWNPVGAKGSGEIWRLFDEASIGDSTAQVNDISTSTSGAEGYYSEINATANNPNAVNTTQNMEWDWPIENNGATANTSYCFRMAVYDETPAFSYNADSYPRLVTAPGNSNLMKHGNTFRLDSEQAYFWAN